MRGSQSDLGATLIVILSVLLIALGAASGVAALHRSADHHRQAEHLLTRVEAQANALSALEWQAIARQDLPPEVARDAVGLRTSLASVLDELAPLGVGAEELPSVKEALRVYQEALDDEFGLLREGRIEEALAIDKGRVDPAFVTLSDVLTDARPTFRALAEQRERIVDVGSFTVLLLAAFTIAYLFRQYQRQSLRRQGVEAKALRELGRLRSELLNVVSHELRTPLSLVHGYAELLQTGTFDPEQARAMAREIYWGSTSMARILDDLLEFNRLERGYLRLNPEEADLAQVARAAVQAFAHTHGSERIVSEIPATLPARVDTTRVGQITANLVANALKYAPDGPIWVRLWEAPAGQAVLEVRDAGPGMPPEVLGRVWEMFYRGPDAQDSALRGAGIGLPLVKRLAEAHGGTVEAESALGRGTTFRVRLPVRCATVLGASSETPPSASPVARAALVS